MHRIDGDAQYPAGHFSPGDPDIPRQPTQVTAEWLDDVQEEVVSIVLGAGLTLIKGTAQLGAVVANLNVAQTFTALKTFAAGLVASVTSGTAVTGTSTATGGAGIGVSGTCLDGTGTFGQGIVGIKGQGTLTGVLGTAPYAVAGTGSTVGVTGKGTGTGIAGSFEARAERAAINLGVLTALPTAANAIKGDSFFLESGGTLHWYVCKVDGTPGPVVWGHTEMVGS